MLKSSRHVDLLEIKDHADKFYFRQKHGSIVPRKFNSSSRYACILESTNYIPKFNFNEFFDLTNMDYEWKSSVEEMVQVNFSILKGKVVDVINYCKKGYRNGFMIILNINFKKEYIQKFWDMCDIYISNFYNSKFESYTEKKDYYESLYNRFVLKLPPKRLSNVEPEIRTKRARIDSYSSLISDISNHTISHQPQLRPVYEHQPMIQHSYNQIGLDQQIPTLEPDIISPTVFNPEEKQYVSKSSYLAIKFKYNELKLMKDRCYRDACQFKKKLQETELKFKNIENQLLSLKQEYDFCIKQNEALMHENTALKTEFNKRNINF